MFVDVVKIFIKSGNGGNGAVSFHREKYMPNGGPDGGDGGCGGDVVFQADKDMRTLLDFRFQRHYKAEDGGHGRGDMCRGKRGEDIVIRVPQGTVIKDAETGNILADMFYQGQKTVVLRGGMYGKGNSRFATATRQAPNFAQSGEITKEHTVILELKTIADVGLVGFPNVGKSTILSVVSKARPKIANYHFTTLSPNLGVVSIDGKSFVLADIPGLIEGAAQGIGLGHDFLRHIERTRMLLHVVDISGCEGRDPVEDYKAINAELAQYSEVLASLPQLIVANKSEMDYEQQNLKRLQSEVNGEIYSVSAAMNQGFRPLLRKVAEILETLPVPEPIPAEELSSYEEDKNAFEITRQGNLFTVTGPAIDRLLSNVVMNDYESFEYFQRQLRKKGIIDALREKGAKEGSAVSMGEMEFDFVD